MIKNKIKLIDYRHYIAVIITVMFMLLGAFIFRASILRLLMACRDLGLSLAYYVLEAIGVPHSVTPTVTLMPTTPELPIQIPLPETSQEFKNSLSAWGKLLISLDNLKAFFASSGTTIALIFTTLLMLIPIFILISFVFKRSLDKENNDYNYTTTPLKIFQQFAKHTYIPAKKFITGLVNFLKTNNVYLKLWIFIWLVNLNILSVIIAFFAFAFYFVVSFDVANIYTQLKKLFIDLSPVFKHVPVWVWVIIALIIFNRFRHTLGLNRLRHMENKNKGFINITPVVTMIEGTMGVGKTKTMSDMSLSQVVIFRDTALKKMIDINLKFPFFTWAIFENILKKAITYGQVYNLATCTKFIEKKAERFFKYASPAKLYDYDYNRYAVEYDNKLYVENLFTSLETYTKLYFIYIIQSSLLVANYSIRTDNIFIDSGNLPMWNNDFFTRNSRQIDIVSRNAHILDFDMLRLGKKLIEDNENANLF